MRYLQYHADLLNLVVVRRNKRTAEMGVHTTLKEEKQKNITVARQQYVSSLLSLFDTRKASKKIILEII